MQPQTPTRWRRVYLVLFWLAFALGLAGLRSQIKPQPDAWMRNLTNNPDKFFLWMAGTNASHVFNYDPRAADEWRFEKGCFLAAPPRPAAAPVFLDLNLNTPSSPRENEKIR